MNELSMLSWCYEVAPKDLPILRSARYIGDHMSIALGELSEEDGKQVRKLYELLAVVYDRLHRLSSGSDSADAGVIAGWTEWRQLVRSAQAINAGLSAQGERVGRVLHDIRGGSLVALLGTAEMLPFSRSFANDVLRCEYFARDHMKIMRNCISDIDTPAAERDRTGRAHSVRLLVEKWAHDHLAFEGKSRRLRFACDFAGDVSERCLELSALDRVIYNLINNAARHTADGEVGLAILAVGQAPERSARFVIWNGVTEEQAQQLRSMAGAQAERLMVERRSTTGGGLGLRICAEFVAHSYGLRSVTEVVQRGYAGTKLDGSRFISWFHWPAVN